MSLKGKAFLCVWNDHDPDQASEYEAWHTFEHVPERVCVPGFLSGRRYAGYDRTESRYFTLYDIASLDVLETAAYRDLQTNPTPWSARMRQAFRNFERIPCHTLASEGIGCAGATGALVFSVASKQTPALGTLHARLKQLLVDHVITAYHLGYAPDIPAYSVFDTRSLKNGIAETVVVIVEGLSSTETDAAMDMIVSYLPEVFDAPALVKCESSNLLFNVDAVELAGSPLRRPECLESSDRSAVS